MIFQLFIILFSVPAALFADLSWHGEHQGGFSADVSLSAQSLPVDENLKVTVKLRYPTTYEPNLDQLRMNVLKYVGLTEPPFALVSEVIENPQENEKKVTYILEPLLDGVQFLSLYNISFLPKNSKENKVETIISDIFEIEVTLPSAKEDYSGVIYPLLSLTKRFPITITQDNRIAFTDSPSLLEKQEERNEEILKERSFPWPELLGVLLFGIILLIARMQPPRKKNQEEERRKLAISAQAKAFTSLTALEKENLPETEAFEQYYNRLTDTVRQYIEEKYRIEATTQTTPEFLEAMSKHPSFDDKTKSLLKEFLIASDNVKFASYQPSSEECGQAHSMALRFING